ncbi:hypothetical protein EJ04DRAFT_511229 [Polyplosphaeria fusca]|uniref:Uncharacterized protein n=1 Tax=Polyplosphaeria fusca TaxID=682080 RepID=A0A9P4R3Y0_9PLEO|nr:hypothetical protein EJ04DRAFT_511229 [Polyplosphaeria fusca]
MMWNGSSWSESPCDALIGTMSGELGWQKFKQGASDSLLNRCQRLNVKIPDKQEPKPSDTTAMDNMEQWIRDVKFYSKITRRDFTPIVDIEE